MQPPLARDLAEAVGLCRTMDRAGKKFVVGLQRRFAGAYRRARAMLPRLGRPYLVQAHYLCNLGPSTGWRADRASGGGALRELAYPMLDLVVWLLGLPESVYSVVGAVPAARRPMDQPVYDTEDTAVAMFRYGDNAAATITVSRCFSPVSEGLTAYCERGVLTVDAARCLARDRDGRAIDGYEDPEPPAALFGRMIDAFVAAADEDAATYPCSAWEDLLTVAAVDAAGLSDRTRQPELPAGLLAGYDVTPGDCLKAAAPPEEEP
jgi:predicted dehydrogenase